MLKRALGQTAQLPSTVSRLGKQQLPCAIRHHGTHQRFSARADAESSELEHDAKGYRARALGRPVFDANGRRPGGRYMYKYASRSRAQDISDDLGRPRDSFRQSDGDKYENRPRNRHDHNLVTKPRRRTWTPRPNRDTPTSLVDSEALLRAIRTAFPHVKHPTTIQAELIPAMHRGEDILLMDEAGSGKTFGSVLGMLSETQKSHLGITTLYIVPHRELAYQIEHWCQKLLGGESSAETLASHVRVLARPNVDLTLASIKQGPPRILITTPGALIDAMTHDRHPLKLHLSLRRIIVDEVDVVMRIWDRYQQPTLSNRHRPEAAQAIDRILEDTWRLKRPKPQMVMMSATLWVHVRTWLFAQNGWMAERVVRLDGIKTRQQGEDGFVSTDSDRLIHSAIVVEQDGTLRNMVRAKEEDASPSSERGILSHKPALILEALSSEEPARTEATVLGSDVSDETAAIKPTSPHSFSKIKVPPSVFEAIATSVALDVTNRAMCVFPAGAPVIPIVEEFRKLGVNARLLNLGDDIKDILRPVEPESSTSMPSTGDSHSNLDHENSKSSIVDDKIGVSADDSSPNPTLIVTTTKTIRGLDIPTLSHIYIVGGVRSVAAYRHIAGRVGRFGMHGTAVSFVDADGSGNLGGLTGEQRLQNYLKQIGANITPFEHI